MIDKHAFAVGMALLKGSLANAPRKDDENVTRAYYAILSAALTTEEFERAVQLTLATERFWVSPAVLLEKVRPQPTPQLEAADTSLEAAAMFDRIWDLGTPDAVNGTRWNPERIESACGTRALAAFWAIGGQTRFRSTSVEELHWLRKDFVTAYREATTVADAGLPLAPVLARKQIGSGQPMRAGALLAAPKREPETTPHRRPAA